MNGASFPPTDRAPARPGFARWLEATNDVTRTFLAAGRIPGLINLAGGLPAPETYPAAELADLARRAIERHPQDTLGYGPIEGLPELRDALAARFGTPELRLGRENVLVTSSGMQGLNLIGKALLDEGGLIAGQFPTYLGALDAWRPRRPAFRDLVLDRPEFDPVASLAGARFAYAVPNFSNPTGRLVGRPTRQALVDAAHATGTWLVEDDPYGGLQYDGEPLPRMVELSGRQQSGRGYDGPVVYMGTLSKEIAPGLRIGWVVAAPSMIEALTLAKQGSDMCTSGVTQRIALGALEGGLIDRLQPIVVGLYRERRDALCAALSEHLAEWFDWEVPVGGMFVWAVARDPSLDTDRLLPLALEAGVCIAPSSAFDASGRNRRAMRVNFTLNPPDRLACGVKRLAGVVRALLSRKDGRRGASRSGRDSVGSAAGRGRLKDGRARMAGEPPHPIFFFAPFVSSTMRVEPSWIDYNGHMNMAYYHVLFDRAVDEAFGAVGLGPDYVEERNASFFAAELHTLYRRELTATDHVRTTLQLIDHDEKRLHYYLEIRHAEDGFVAATSENLSLHVDLRSKRVSPFPDNILRNLAVMKAAHARLPRPAALGRIIGLPRRDREHERPLAAGTRH